MSVKKEKTRRDRILDYLEGAGGWISGEYISDELGISRSAVAKHISALRAKGHGIESAPRKGYRLWVKLDLLSPDEIREELETKILGKGDWHYLKETGSSNEDAIIMAAQGAEEGTIVIAEGQSQGRGRKGGLWLSTPRGLQLSLILRPACTVDKAQYLIKAGAVAMAQAIDRSGDINPKVKFPNELTLGGKKISGILLELGLEGEDIAWAVLGIGCNINARRDDFPDTALESISSLFIERGKAYSRTKLLCSFLERMEFWYQSLVKKDEKDLVKAWESFL